MKAEWGDKPLIIPQPSIRRDLGRFHSRPEKTGIPQPHHQVAKVRVECHEGLAG